ncbi:tyrosine-type recombinase/integrase [Actinophytocola sp.]|jgi:integrase/DNA-binding transcriptional regulator YhcF (GntR family)|uniref:tyrosine-type recombinase/integrase n=1 Tax=Actinophytocola sp. TaxID=1872138 RepID=UPI002ED9E4B2
MTSTSRSKRKGRGEIERLPSGSLRVRIYAGTDPVTGKRHRLEEIVPAGPNAEDDAERALTRLLSQRDEQRNARTRATVNQLLDRYFALTRVEQTTKENYESLARLHIRPLLGDVSLAKINGETLDSFYNVLRKCRARCQGRKYIEHRTDRPHKCDEKCGPHKCKGLADGSLRKIHAVLSGAGKRAVRWGWLGVNPFGQADPLPAARPHPKPPTADQAAKIATQAWKDLDWGMLVWLAMVTGARRGELCALAWDRVTLKPGAGVLEIRSSIAQRGGRTWEKDTKTHQQRRITIDDATVGLLAAYQRRCAQRAGLGEEMPGDARIFSNSPDGSRWLKPDSVSQRYARMCARKPLEWDMNIHQLRHYSATELISAGVDVTTVGGRLGHGGGGSTTLRFYSAWVSEADQRAAGTLSTRLPELPVALDPAGALKSTVQAAEDTQYKRIAADLRGAIVCGALKPGDTLPPFAELASRYGVAFNTAQRAVKVLKSDGLVTVSRGRRAVVASPDTRRAQSDVVSLQTRRRAT